MSDDRIDDGLNAYADSVRRTTRPTGGADIRRRARQRKQRRAYAAAFGVVLMGSVGLGVAVSRQSPDRPAEPLPAASVSTPVLPLPTIPPTTTTPPTSTTPTAPTTPTTPPSSAPSRTSATPSGPADARPALTSDVSQLRELGIDIGPGVLIDVADDGEDRWMQIGDGGVVDFTGATRTDTTMMSLQPAPVTARTDATRNRVTIKPPFWNEGAEGDGHCVADTPGAALALETCRAGDAAQVWTVLPAGDSGQFELEGRYGVVRVDDGRITTDPTGRVGLQTIPFAG